MASRIVYTAVVRLCQKSPRIDRTVALFLGNGARYLALVFTFVAVLTTFGIATTSFVAVLGALGIAVGLALQGTLSNLAAGIMLVLFRPFHIGDRIETANVGGTVCEINLFFTEIDGDDNARIIIPNGKLWGEIVRVPTRNDTARIELTFQRPANDDIGAAIGRLQGTDRARQAGAAGRRHRRRQRRRRQLHAGRPSLGVRGAMPRRCASTSTARSRKSSSAGPLAAVERRAG